MRSTRSTISVLLSATNIDKGNLALQKHNVEN